MSAPQENRQHTRAKIRWPITIRLPDGPIEGQTVNLSINGAYIYSDQRPKLGKTLSEQIPNPGEILAMTLKPPKRSFFEINAKLCWIRDERIISVDMGTCFTNISDEDRLFLSAVISG
ncbi:MAG: PilZ domain-containing protein [Desulfobacterales bacterium]|jgi:hypothetical protein